LTRIDWAVEDDLLIRNRGLLIIENDVEPSLDRMDNAFK
jgi:hypothetical protein